MAEYERWIVEETPDGLEARLERPRGVILNAVAGGVVVAAGLWLRTRPRAEAVASGVLLVGLFWLLMAALAWLGDRRLRITAKELVWERTPGGTDRYSRSAVRGVRIVGLGAEKAGLRSPALPWRVELEPAEEGTSLPMSFRFEGREAAERFARRLSAHLGAPLLEEGSPDAD